MKIRFLAVVSLLLVAGSNNSVQANQAAAREALPNFDQRKEGHDAPAVNSQRAAATTLLSSQVNGLRLRRDPQTGGPRYLAAQRGFLTGPGIAGRGVSAAALAAVPMNESHRIVKAFVNDNADLFGHGSAALNEAKVKVDASDAQTGLHTVIWQQQIDNIPLYGGLFVSHRTRHDEVVSISSRFVADLSGSANRVGQRGQLVMSPPIGAQTALRLAAQNLGESNTAIELEQQEQPEGFEKKQSFTSSRLVGEAHAQLVWFPSGENDIQLCWQTILTSRVRPEMYLLLVNAKTGAVVLRRSLTDHVDATYNVFTSDSPSPFSPGLATPSNFQPPVVPRTLVTLSQISSNASPNGWIPSGGNETRGNNVDAHLDRNDDNLPDLPRPQGIARVFDFPMDLSQGPQLYGDASVVNLFYWNNFCHDRLYELGFTEPFGNFQNTNFGRGGVGMDAVEADAQDGGGFNNANFSTPPDGFRGRMQMYLFDGANPDRDGSLDAEVMIHEYVHGLSNRLLGGGAGISELQTAGMGEGWSDFYALALLSEPTDDPNGNYAAGGYLTYKFYSLQDNYYFGIRRYPYSTDMSKNPLTFKDIDPTKASAHAGVPISPIFGGGNPSEVHAQGEVWCVALWEARANLVEKLGPVVGNDTILRLVTHGLKLAPENATFLEARDGILQADEVLTGGDNVAELWFAFAKRGMGYSAVAPPSDTTVGVVEAYDVPGYVNVGAPDGILEVKLTPSTGNALFGNITNQIFVRVTDSTPVTNATITSSLSLGGSLTFRNDGQAPDLAANNAIYSADYVTPNVTTNVTLTVVISAQGKDTTTNVVVYNIVPVPLNDNMTNATKVPAIGGNYVTLNQRATLEAGEPVHAGVPSETASLWWLFTPAVNGSVLIDTAGSAVNTVLAVYTNNTFATMKAVVSADDVGNRKQAFVFLDGKAGVSYRIAVASYDSNNKGTIRLAIVPGGSPDTNAPSVTVISPPSGLILATNRLMLVGTAIDPDPNPAGLQEIEFRVNRLSIAGVTGAGDISGGFTTSSLISTNWTRTIGLYEGLNQIEVSVKDGAGNRSASVFLQATYRPQDPPNDIFANAITLTGVAGTNTVNTLRATKEVNEPNHATNPGGKSAWWNYQPPVNGELLLSTTNSTFDTLLAVYTGSTVGTLKLLAQNDDDPNGVGGVSSLALAVRSNQVYRIAVDGYEAAAGAVFLQHQLTPATVYQLTVTNGNGGVVTPGTMDVVAGRTVQLTATPNAGFQFDIWSGSIVSLVTPLQVVMNGNRTVTGNFLPIAVTDGFESGNFSGLGWTTGGSVPWLVVSTNSASGNFAARSGVIGSSQSSSLLLNRTFRAGVGSFDLRVSSEAVWDRLSFYLDGVMHQQWSGEVAWSGFGFPISAGAHTLEWRYTKDPNNSTGMDAAFIDNVNLPVVVAVSGATPAQLTVRRQTDGMVFIDLLGQTNQLYTVQTSTNLITWQALSTQVVTSGFVRVLDPGSLTNKMRFYRAVTPTP